jgi:two-component system, OmpR family, sensor kinase
MTTTMTMTMTMTTTTMTTTMTMTTDQPGAAPWRRRWGIRHRVVFSYLALLVAALTISLLVTRQSLLSAVERDVDQSLAQEIEELRLATDDVDPDTGEPFGTDVEGFVRSFMRRSVPGEHEAFYAIVGGEPFLYNAGAPNLFDLDPALSETWATTGEARWGRSTTTVGEVRYLATPLVAEGRDAGVFVVAYFPEPDRAAAHRAVRILAVAGAVVVLLTGAFAWSIAGRVLRPVRELTETARGISDTDLSGRIPVTGRDELSELGATFNDMIERLDQGFAGQRQFLDDVAHELRTPITIVQGNLELMSDDPAERAETLTIVNDELDRMNRYVTDLLLLAKAETTEFLRPEPVDLGELALSVHQKMQGIADRNWLIDQAPAPGAVAIVVDPDRITQALLNLATNAVQHTEPGATVAVGLTPVWSVGEVAGARLWVRDNGPGLDPALVDRLFDRRVRGAASRTERVDGLGIGLSIVAAIARAHGGSVTASNEPTGGARFTLTLPMSPDGTDDPHHEEITS